MPEDIIGVEKKFVCAFEVGGMGVWASWLLSQNDLSFPEVKFSLSQIIVNYSNFSKVSGKQQQSEYVCVLC